METMYQGDGAICKEEPMKSFPLFINLEDKKVVVVGGGTIGSRRIKALLHFSARIYVIAPDLNDELKELVNSGQIRWKSKEYQPRDVEGAYLVLAATDNRQVNRKVGMEGRQQGALVNVCDRKEECDFYFPGIAEMEQVVVGVSASGMDHGLAKAITERIQNLLSEK